ncbi:MAG: helix-turn-helix transcriptional regulator [Cryomorphaceae bacterium]
MPANKYALLRYRIIDRMISSKYNPYPNKEDLRQACEDELYGSDGARISTSTIDKDIYAMRNESNLGYYAPIEFSKAEKGYYYKDPEYTIDKMPLNEDDLEAIQFAANTLYQFRGLNMFKSSEAAIDKILDRFALNPDNAEKSVDSFVQFETSPSFRGGKHLPDILSAIKSRQVIRFSYAKYTGGEQKQYHLHPYLLKEYRNRWYVIGFNPDKGAVVVFGLDRMVGEVTVTAETFDPNPDFDPSIYFEHSIGITAVDSAPERIHLRFSTLTGKYVESQPLHASQKIIHNDEVALEIELSLCITKELVMQILSYGSDVEVKSPEKLRQQIARQLNAAAKYYR